MADKNFSYSELAKARKALALLKQQRAKGETAASKIERGEFTQKTVLKQINGNYRKTFKASELPEKKPRYSNKEENDIENIIPSRHFDQAFGEDNIDFQKHEIVTKEEPKVDRYPKMQRTTYFKPQENMNIEEINEKDEFDLSECNYCHRKFNSKSLEKHLNACDKRPDKPKRKVFNSAKNRIVEQKEGIQVKPQSKQQPKPQTIDKKQTLKRIPLWKTQSESFRRAIGAKPSSDQIQIENEVKPIDYVKCNTCGRSFNTEAAKRHIPFCAERLKMEKLKNPHKCKKVHKN